MRFPASLLTWLWSRLMEGATRISSLWARLTGSCLSWTVQLHSPRSSVLTSLSRRSLPSSLTTILSSV